MKLPFLLNLVFRFVHPKAEWFEVVDESGKTCGRAPRKICHNGKSFLLHKVVHLIVVNPQGYLLLQKRSMNKDIQPGKWDTSVGGHVNFGEGVFQALFREAKEELGLELKAKHVKFLYSYVMQSDKERELVHTYLVRINKRKFTFQKSEIDSVRFWSVGEIRNTIGKGVFTPNFEDEFRKYMKSRSQK